MRPGDLVRYDTSAHGRVRVGTANCAVLHHGDVGVILHSHGDLHTVRWARLMEVIVTRGCRLTMDPIRRFEHPEMIVIVPFA